MTDFVVCVSNQDYAASLEIRKIYRTLPDDHASKLQMVRVIDETGEDYLYPQTYFLPIALPEPIQQALAL
jgi:hypothetical protein